MIRLHGRPPYKTILIHGGPGAVGSLEICADRLSRLSGKGVAEALQSKYSIAELKKELYEQIWENCAKKVTLIGHSWGAWLAALFAAEYPLLCENVVLVGCPPLQDQYVEDIHSRRMQNLSQAEREIFRRLAENRASDEDMGKIPQILERSDNYCLEYSEIPENLMADSRMHNCIWSEAAALRTAGDLLAAFQRIRSKLYLIQGAVDPHPAEGVIRPLEEKEISCETYILERCGHSPFQERYAKEEFYRILLQICK